VVAAETRNMLDDIAGRMRLVGEDGDFTSSEDVKSRAGLRTSRSLQSVTLLISHGLAATIVLIESDGSSLMPFLGTTIVFSALNSHA
jgi:hypothetical protein